MSNTTAPWVHRSARVDDAAALSTLAEWLSHVQLASTTDQEELERCSAALERIALASGVLMRQLGDLSLDRCDFTDHLLADERHRVAEAQRAAFQDALGSLVERARQRRGRHANVVPVQDLLPLLPARLREPAPASPAAV
ncbi:hypothetical protein [Cellulomonas fimi]|uniref:Uncharacterized protein n=1 Tax=Cellulomonas fimi (strain ATCC 484 / DSM 20113 / JCM 1341 / CCUG 24087 / LMG 16345 / NBRC 15513 / NCIMB 8980 / NCTC 7547 / NRS-133) TaxID=590998 RepID=F4H204_CELFA|nr:hypothetical protein [Cellulomonas fimi]AEE45174.1 hypothetical protein Celf_1037 [Cellulomonas fimi ATCC 484]NNH06263.1 hypothetical protein [Cellulomonas fimi]VEH28465.1 Uncharacterised protein [Cellulomonas fimi]